MNMVDNTGIFVFVLLLLEHYPENDFVNTLRDSMNYLKGGFMRYLSPVDLLPAVNAEDEG